MRVCLRNDDEHWWLFKIQGMDDTCPVSFLHSVINCVNINRIEKKFNKNDCDFMLASVLEC